VNTIHAIARGLSFVNGATIISSISGVDAILVEEARDSFSDTIDTLEEIFANSVDC
jgi:hypothetical protein